LPLNPTPFLTAEHLWLPWIPRSKHAGSSWAHKAPAVKWPPHDMQNRHHRLGSLGEAIVARIPMRKKWPDG